MQQPDASKPEGTVVAELAKGYRLRDRVLRPAKVAVSVIPHAHPRLDTRGRGGPDPPPGGPESMPTYDYICDACGHEFEAFESIKADPQTICPSCHEAKLRRKIGPGAAILFKGRASTRPTTGATPTRRGPRPTSRPRAGQVVRVQGLRLVRLVERSSPPSPGPGQDRDARRPLPRGTT